MCVYIYMCVRAGAQGRSQGFPHGGAGLYIHMLAVIL